MALAFHPLPTCGPAAVAARIARDDRTVAHGGPTLAHSPHSTLSRNLSTRAGQG